MLLVGTSVLDSRRAIEFAHAHAQHCWAAVGVHPHEASRLAKSAIKQAAEDLAGLAEDDKVVAIGECGLDFYYNDRSEYLGVQRELLEIQLQVASNHSLPVSFHVREAFDDFWPILDNFPGLTGVLHSFTDTQKQLDKGLARGLFIGVNGIATFTSHQWQRELFRTLPLENIVVETDAPFLTPIPRRGTINTPENVIYITKFLAELRGDNADHIAQCTTENARKIFGFS